MKKYLHNRGKKKDDNGQPFLVQPMSLTGEEITIYFFYRQACSIIVYCKHFNHSFRWKKSLVIKSFFFFTIFVKKNNKINSVRAAVQVSFTILSFYDRLSVFQQTRTIKTSKYLFDHMRAHTHTYYLPLSNSSRSLYSQVPPVLYCVHSWQVKLGSIGHRDV